MMPRLFTADVEPLRPAGLEHEDASMMPRLFTADVTSARRFASSSRKASMMPRLFTADVRLGDQTLLQADYSLQ